MNEKNDAWFAFLEKLKNIEEKVDSIIVSIDNLMTYFHRTMSNKKTLKLT